jgi:hypothetical protein
MKATAANVGAWNTMMMCTYAKNAESFIDDNHKQAGRFNRGPMLQMQNHYEGTSTE